MLNNLSSIDFRHDYSTLYLTGEAHIYSRTASKLKYCYCTTGCYYKYDYIYDELLYTTDTK